MSSSLFRFAAAMLIGAVFAGCASTYRWGVSDDPEWSPRVGQTTFAEVTRVLGQPAETLRLPSGDMKVRWFARPLSVSETHGTMEDFSVEHTEDRAQWRDMRFDQGGRMTRAWLSDQRDLAASEGP
jgi:hypothetical protein